MGRERRILLVGLAGATCFAVGLALAGPAVAHHAPFVPIGIAVLGMLLVGTALERRRRAAGDTAPVVQATAVVQAAIDTAPSSGDLA